MSKKGVNDLEKTINNVNLLYRKSKEALIIKVPVPIILTDRGLVAQKSTVDYTGILNGGKFIAFDTKETMSKTSFPLANIHQHQLIYLEYVEVLKGISFFMIQFKNINKNVFITPISLIKKYWYGNSRKSIPFTEFNNDWICDTSTYLTKVRELYES